MTQNEDPQRLQKLGHDSARLPVLGLIAQCYGLIEASLQPGSELNAEVFTRVFDNIVVHGPVGINLMFYDEMTSAFYIVDVVKVDIKSIQKVEVPVGRANPFGHPQYTISSQLTCRVHYGGTPEQLYQISEFARAYIVDGWNNIVPTQGVEPLNHITPYDLCACGNLMELATRMTMFLEYVMGYRSPYHKYVEIPGNTIIDIPEMISIGLYFSMSLEYFGTIVRQLQDPDVLKSYIAGGYVDFHTDYVDNEVGVSLAKEFKKCNKELDTRQLRVVHNLLIPEVVFTTMTSVRGYRR